MTIAAAVFSGFGLALVAPSLHQFLQQKTGKWLALLPCGLLVYFLSLLFRVSPDEARTVSFPWVPALQLEFSFRIDGLSLLFAVLISGMGAFVLVYAGRYLCGHPALGRLYAWLLVFMAAMLGLVLANNLLLIFVFWELTSFCSYMLVGFKHEREQARAAALQAFLITGAGGLALLAGFLLLGRAAQSFDVSVLLDRGAALQAHSLYVPSVLLILAGAFTKSAQVPFHFWLPGAMEAPTPVSAYLHSATMVKAGVYLLARLHPALGGAEFWHYAVTLSGAVTMLAGAILAFPQTDLKRLLAYSTVSALGTLMLLLGLGTAPAIKAAMVFLLVHALYKGALFLVAGIVDHETGTRDVTKLSGLRRHLPLTTAAAGLAALSMAGLPPLFGFISKELLYEAKVQAPYAALAITAAGVAANIFLVAVAIIVGIRPFVGRLSPAHPPPHEASASLLLGPLFLAGAGALVGLFPDTLATPLIAPAIAAVHPQATEIKLELWHGVNPIFLLSVFTVLCGVGLFFLRFQARRLATTLPVLSWWNAARGYDLTIAGLRALAAMQTRFLQHGSLPIYLFTIIATTIILALFLPGVPTFAPLSMPWPELRFHEVVIAGMTIVAAAAAVRARSRLGAVIALGIVGYGVALLFAVFGAPDLAVTQFLVESLAAILFALVLLRLPDARPDSSTLTRARNAGVALAFGGLITLLLLAAIHLQFSPSIEEYFVKNSLPLGHGRNVVNVILVDFRALDTLGEITVLGIAALGVSLLVRSRKEKAS